MSIVLEKRQHFPLQLTDRLPSWPPLRQALGTRPTVVADLGKKAPGRAGTSAVPAFQSFKLNFFSTLYPLFFPLSIFPGFLVKPRLWGILRPNFCPRKGGPNRFPE